MSLILIHSDRFLDHRPPPGHPERVERAEVMSGVAAAWKQRGRIVQAPRPATHAELLRVHSDSYLKAIDNTAGRAVSLDPDTYTSPESRDVALLAAGAAIGGVEAIVQSRATRVMALVRPPGHHAERERAMGFCFYNSIAAAAAEARARGVERVAIVDYDVHHGNGTQEMFYADPSVLYVSLHQSPLYPGSGAAQENGTGDGRGYTLNVPLSAGAGDAAYGAAIERIVAPVLEGYRPDLLLFSAGFDAHARDPLAQMELSDAGFRTIVRRTLAALDPGVPVGMALEGGYDLIGLGSSLGAVLAGLGEGPLHNIPAERLWQAHERDLRAVSAVAAELWKLG